MKVAYCKIITGKIIKVNYDESMTTRDFKEMLLSSWMKAGPYPDDAILSEFKMLNTSAPCIPQELIANEDTMASVPIDPNLGELEICWSFREATYNARIKESKIAFLQGLHSRLGQNSSILKMKKDSIFDNHLLSSVFGFLNQSTKQELSESKVESPEEETEQTTFSMGH